MPITKVSEEYILKQALKVFREKSYHHATMADIASACGLLKGSIYHYFPGKEDLMKNVLKLVHEYFRIKVFSIASRVDLSGQQKLVLMVKNIESIFIEPEGGCIMGNIGVETSRVIPEFSGLIQDYFNDWIDAFTQVFMEKYAEQKAREVAIHCVAEIEGSVMLSRIFNDPVFLKQANQRVIARIL